jgi:hypothetical protein
MTIKYYDTKQLYDTFEYPFVMDHRIKSGKYYNAKGAKAARKRHPEPIIQRQLLIDFGLDWREEFPKYVKTERFYGHYTVNVESLYIQSNRWRYYDLYIWTPELHAWVQEMNKLFGTSIKPKYLTYTQYQNIDGIHKYVTQEEADKLEMREDKRIATFS